jgi:hypothetical protein
VIPENELHAEVEAEVDWIPNNGLVSPTGSVCGISTVNVEAGAVT